MDAPGLSCGCVKGHFTLGTVVVTMLGCSALLPLHAQEIRVMEVIPTSQPLPLREVQRSKENSNPGQVVKTRDPRALSTKRLGSNSASTPSDAASITPAPPVLVPETNVPVVRTDRSPDAEPIVVPTLDLPDQPEQVARGGSPTWAERGQRSSWVDVIEQVDGQSVGSVTSEEMEPIYDANAPQEESTLVRSEPSPKPTLPLTEPTPELVEQETQEPVLVRFALTDVALLQQAARQAGGDLEVILRPKGVTPQQLVAPLLRTGAFHLRKDADGLVIVSAPRGAGYQNGNGPDTDRKLALMRARDHLLSQLAEVEDALK